MGLRRWKESQWALALEMLIHLISFIAGKEGDVREVESLLYKHRGLFVVSGLTHDMRELLEEVHENKDRRASLAIEIFCYRVRKYVGAYLV